MHLFASTGGAAQEVQGVRRCIHLGTWAGAQQVRGVWRCSDILGLSIGREVDLGDGFDLRFRVGLELGLDSSSLLSLLFLLFFRYHI